MSGSRHDVVKSTEKEAKIDQHHSEVIMDAAASQITNLTIFYQPFIQAYIEKTAKLRITGLCAGNSPVTGEFPAQIASNAENVSIWWRQQNDEMSAKCWRFRPGVNEP